MVRGAEILLSFILAFHDTKDFFPQISVLWRVKNTLLGVTLENLCDVCLTMCSCAKIDVR